MKTAIIKKVSFVFISLLVIFEANSQWKSLPLRSQSEFNSGAQGGEAEQYLHGFSRCFTQPNYIYGSQDVCGSWRSEDGGKSWKKNLDQGLFLPYTTSIEVDPVNPKILMMGVDEMSMWVKTVWSQEGIYRSLDGGSSWKLVLNSHQDFNVPSRRLRHVIEYSLPSMLNGNTSPTRWYSSDSTSLYRSDASGDSASWIKTTTFPWININNQAATYIPIMSINAHPTLKDIVYVATQTGLYKSIDAGVTLTSIATFSGKYITNILMNAKIPGVVYVSVKDDGLYKSTDDGTTFSQMHPIINGTKDISAYIQRAFMNPGFPEQIYLVAGGYPFSCVSNDGGTTWTTLPYATSNPGFDREQSWRLALLDLFTGICPNPQNKNQASVSNVASLWEITNATTTPVVKESSSGYTGGGTGLNDSQITFNPNDPTNFGIFCYDVGPRITTTSGDWFQTDTNLNNNWRPNNKISWAGSYAAAYQPLMGSKVVVASIGRYFNDIQLMRSIDGGLTWGTSPVIPYTSTYKQAFNFIGFDLENTNNVYSGNLKSTDAGLTFLPITFPSQWYETVNGVSNVSPVVLGMSHDVINKVTAIFAVDGFGTQILRSVDCGASWINFYNIGTSLTSNIRFLDSTPTFIAHPTNNNVVFTLANNHDLVKITYNPTKPILTKVTNMNVFNAIPSYVTANVKAFLQIRRIAFDPVDPNVMYVVLSGSGFPTVYRTTDGGTTWTSISDDLPHHTGMVAVNPTTREVYFGSMCGTYIHPAPITGFETVKVNDNLNVYVDQINQKLILTGAYESDNFTITDFSGKTLLNFKGASCSLSKLLSGVYIIYSSNHQPKKIIKF